MRTRSGSNRRSVIAAIAITAGLAVSATACGSDDGTDDPGDSPSDTDQMIDSVPTDDMVDDTIE